MNDILFKDYESYVRGVSRRVKELSTAPVREQKLPLEYLCRRDIDKDRRARDIAAERGISD
jgi:hypothetical protein